MNHIKETKRKINEIMKQYKKICRFPTDISPEHKEDCAGPDGYYTGSCDGVRCPLIEIKVKWIGEKNEI